MVKNKMKIIAFMLVVLLILSSVFIYYRYLQEKEIRSEKTDEPTIIDDRISPYENQGVFVEINRIRHRGLINELTKFGSRKWMIEPSFYYTVDIDGLQVNSRDASGLGAKSADQLFITWDTMFQEHKIPKDVEEEQEESTIIIQIIEVIKSGLLNLKTEDVVREEIKVTYDYRTGRWAGDDYPYDKDGYGHYLGDTFEIWFNIYQTGRDSDGIPYWTEVNILHTDPSVDDSFLDPDDDGIPTAWEWKWGYDPHSWDDHANLDPDIDGLENIEEYKVAKYFADPYSQDIYIEVDGMEKGGFFDPPHVMWEESMQGMIERFSEHNIRVYIDNGWPGTSQNAGGESLPHYDVTVDYLGMMRQFYIHHFPDERKGIFHYVVVGHGAGFSYPLVSNKYDTTHLGYNIRQMLNPFRNPYCVPTPRAWRVHLGAMLMHETAHTLGIYTPNIEGNDNHSALFALNPFSKEGREYAKTWGQYYSVTNYYWSTMMDWKKVLFDYSDGSNGPPYDYNDWEYLYLPFFQMEATFVEDVDATPPCHDRIVFENLTDLYLTGWFLNEELTDTYENDLQQRYDNKITISEPLANGLNWRIYTHIENYSSTNITNIRIYGQPRIPPTIDKYAGWSMIWEGTVDMYGNISIYDQQGITNEIQDQISSIR